MYNELSELDVIYLYSFVNIVEPTEFVWYAFSPVEASEVGFTLSLRKSFYSLFTVNSLEPPELIYTPLNCYM